MIPVIVELFVSIQGEGQYTGHPSIFIRTSGCNLRCCFSNSICDTYYTSFEREDSKIYTMEDIKAFLIEHNDINHIVITGGEPLLNKDNITELINNIRNIKEHPDNYVITIETNGTLFVPELNIDLYSISPKLSSSVGDPNHKPSININISDEKWKHICAIQKEKHINIDNLYKLVYGNNCNIQLKFVYNNDNDVTEIQDILTDLEERRFNELQGYVDRCCIYKYLNNLVYLMPAGDTEEKLKDIRRRCAETCIKKGWKYTDRTHIIIWGSKRCV